MTETVVIREPAVIVRTADQTPRVVVSQSGPPGPPGPPGPKGADGIGAISIDAGNAIVTGMDGGLYCPAVISSTLHW